MTKGRPQVCPREGHLYDQGKATCKIMGGPHKCLIEGHMDDQGRATCTAKGGPHVQPREGHMPKACTTRARTTLHKGCSLILPSHVHACSNISRPVRDAVYEACLTHICVPPCVPSPRA